MLALIITLFLAQGGYPQMPKGEMILAEEIVCPEPTITQTNERNKNHK